jgi:excisionase family DNA binding protein
LFFGRWVEKSTMLSSRMQAKQSTQHRSLTNNTEEAVARQPGRPLTKRELARFLGISERFIELEVNRGHLRAVRFSNRLLRFRPVDVERWMESSLTAAVESRRDSKTV